MYQRKSTSLVDCGSFISTHHTFTESNKQKVQNLSLLYTTTSKQELYQISLFPSKFFKVTCLFIICYLDKYLTEQEFIHSFLILDMLATFSLPPQKIERGRNHKCFLSCHQAFNKLKLTQLALFSGAVWLIFRWSRWAQAPHTTILPGRQTDKTWSYIFQPALKHESQWQRLLKLTVDFSPA